MVPVPSSSYVGSAISIGGNVLIAFALKSVELVARIQRDRQYLLTSFASQHSETCTRKAQQRSQACSFNLDFVQTRQRAVSALTEA